MKMMDLAKKCAKVELSCKNISQESIAFSYTNLCYSIITEGLDLFQRIEAVSEFDSLVESYKEYYSKLERLPDEKR